MKYTKPTNISSLTNIAGSNGNGSKGNLDKKVRDLKQQYDHGFEATPEYIETLPDMQNSENNSPKVDIQHVGIQNFKIPLEIATRQGGMQHVHCSVTGTVSLKAFKKGINMSRIIRTFYEYEECDLHAGTLQNVVKEYLQRLEACSARLAIAFDYPIKQKSLRSGLSGYQYYPVVFETVTTSKEEVQQFLHVDFEYSSACPCSYELSLHANLHKGVAAVPHSQRSVARLSLEYDGFLWIEEVVEMCQRALQTETQVMVKREDEQAFAEMNAAHLKFVEDAVRLLHEELNQEKRIKDFRIFASHQESLHSHDAISVLVKGVPGGFAAHIDPFAYPS